MMTRKKNYLFALLATIISSQVIASEMPKEINIVYVKAPFNLQNMVIKEHKLLEKAFAKDNVSIEWKTITSGAKQAQAMAAGAIDISAVMNTASLLMTNGAGNPVKIISGVSHPAETFAIVGKAGQKLDIKDLKGKKVAGPRGTVLHQLLIAALLKNGMKATDVEFISMDQPSTLSALTSGHIDAGLLAASGIIKAEKAGCEVITTAKDLVNVNLVMTAREKFIEDYPEAVEKVVKVQRQALEWINNNWDEAVAIGAKEHGISLEDAQKLAKWSNYYNALNENDIKGLAIDQEFLLDNQMMKQKVNVTELVTSFAKE